MMKIKQSLFVAILLATSAGQAEGNLNKIETLEIGSQIANSKNVTFEGDPSNKSLTAQLGPCRGLIQNLQHKQQIQVPEGTQWSVANSKIILKGEQSQNPPFVNTEDKVILQLQAQGPSTQNANKPGPLTLSCPAGTQIGSMKEFNVMPDLKPRRPNGPLGSGRS